MSGAIAMGTNKITGVGDPTLAQDAATKAYTDSILVQLPQQQTLPQQLQRQPQQLLHQHLMRQTQQTQQQPQQSQQQQATMLLMTAT
jgi:hypothetical protein